MTANDNSKYLPKHQRADGRRNKKLVARERQRFFNKVDEDSGFGCYYRVEKELQIPRATVRYWYLKLKAERDDPNHEPSQVGGQRFEGTIKIWERPVVRQYIVEYLTAFPYSTLQNVANELSFCLERNVTRRVCLLFIFSFANF